MPHNLMHGSSRAIIDENVKTLIAAGYPDQAALRTALRYAKKGKGMKHKSKDMEPDMGKSHKATRSESEEMDAESYGNY